MLTVKIDGLDKAMAMFEPGIVAQAAAQGINDAGRGVRTTTSRQLRRIWNIKKRDLESKMKVVRFARVTELEAELQVGGRPISLTYFGAKHYHARAVTSRTVSRLLKRRSSRSGVIVQIKRGEQTNLENAFIAVMRNGHIGVFTRKGKSRHPIRNMATVTMATMFANKEIQDLAADTANNIFQKRFDHHLRRRLNRG